MSSPRTASSPGRSVGRDRSRRRRADRPSQSASRAARAGAFRGRRWGSGAVERSVPGPRRVARDQPPARGALPAHRRACRPTCLRSGLLDEVRVLLDAGYGPELRPMSGHGYREAVASPGGGVVARAGGRGHGPADAAVREAPAHLVPPRSSHPVGRRRRRAGRRARPRGTSGRPAARRAQLTEVRPIDCRQSATPAAAGSLIGRAGSSEPGPPEVVALSGRDAQLAELRRAGSRARSPRR